MPVPPADVARVARRILEVRRGLPASRRGMTATGLARANQLARRENVSEETLRRMVSFFARHEPNTRAEGFRQGEEGYPSKGRQAWDGWGGFKGRAWARRELRKIEREST